ncbi:MAG: hypothetical protein HIU93_03920 [Acidobacteria bacterium]|nr:hypothetical protein [Acidobacteriota bacterium]MBW4044340.1 hypothetical protein [Acidobacteriota bacterium]
MSTAALGTAALAGISTPAQAENSEVFFARGDWNTASFNKLLRARKTMKQLFDVTAPDGESLALHIHNAFSGLERGFGIPAEKIMIVAALRAGANVMNFDDYAWKKYQIGAAFKINDPATGKPAERNIFYASSKAPEGKYASDDPNDRRSISWDDSIQALQRRGVQLLSCHVATEGFAEGTVNRLHLKESAESVARDLLQHMLPGVIAVPSMVSAIPVLEKQGGFAYLRL